MDTSVPILIVGVDAIASLKVAIIFTTFEPITRLSESLSVKVTLGAELSIVNVMLSIPEYALFAKSLAETVADTIPLVVVDTVQG